MQNYKLGATQAQYKLQACRRTGVIQNNKLQSLQPHRQQNYKLAATQARFKNDKFTATQAKQATDLPPNRLAPYKWNEKNCTLTAPQVWKVKITKSENI